MFKYAVFITVIKCQTVALVLNLISLHSLSTRLFFNGFSKEVTVSSCNLSVI